MLLGWGFGHVVTKPSDPGNRYLEHRPGFVANGGTLDTNWCGQYFTNAVGRLAPGDALQLSFDYRQFGRHSLTDVNMLECFITLVGSDGQGPPVIPASHKFFNQPNGINRRIGFRLSQSSAQKNGAWPDGGLAVTLNPAEYWKRNELVNLNDIGISGMGSMEAAAESDELRIIYTIQRPAKQRPWNCSLVISNQVSGQVWTAETTAESLLTKTTADIYLALNADSEFSGEEGFELDNMECRILHETYPLAAFLTRSKECSVQIKEAASSPVRAEKAVSPAHSKAVPLLYIPKELRRIQAQQARLRSEQALLPRLSEPLQFDGYGYHGGYLPALDELPDAPRWTVDIEFIRDAFIQQILLVPAIDRQSPKAQSYGFPQRFRLWQFYPDGSSKVTREWMASDCPDPGRMPLAIDLPDPRSNRFRLEVFRGSGEGGKELFALDEFYAVVRHEVAKGTTVEVSAAFESPPYWGKQFLIDQKTSLGQPIGIGADGDDPGDDDYSIVFDTPPSDPCVVEIDLGQNRELGWVELFPALPSDGILIPGYGFPRTIELEMVPETQDGQRGESLRVTSGGSVGNPGNNLVRLAGKGNTGRWIRCVVSDFPVHNDKMVFALGEIRVHQSSMAYPIQRVRLVGFPRGADEQAHLLIDGKANGAPVLFLSDWLRQIDQRSQLSRALEDNAARAERLDARWANFMMVSGFIMVLLIVSGALLFAVGAMLQRRRHSKALRHQITTDLHDDLGSKLATISLTSEFIGHQAQNPVVAEGSQSILEVSRELTTSLRDVLWVTDSNTDTLQQLILQLGDIAEKMVGSERLSLIFPESKAIPRKVIEIPAKRDIVLFFREALHNAVKHAQATGIQVEVLVKKKTMTLRIADDGVGFETAPVEARESLYLRKHYGRASMEERAERLHARYRLDSCPGQGTRIELVVPI
ncbi:sensor histidine kinase [Pontiella sulfatireligans]|uniref:Sensor protein VraS n=1 Tax=Pontiella sulfatireligans TaxID=2750658 RepID=A0A6C2ULX1_9BACT|nr:ATP-binding protein [Pontiella sulfatireligans]VGO20427.1 Sensor protein VraS [Pontiella sulfatireligans]